MNHVTDEEIVRLNDHAAAGNGALLSAGLLRRMLQDRYRAAHIETKLTTTTESLAAATKRADEAERERDAAIVNLGCFDREATALRYLSDLMDAENNVQILWNWEHDYHSLELSNPASDEVIVHQDMEPYCDEDGDTVLMLVDFLLRAKDKASSIKVETKQRTPAWKLKEQRDAALAVLAEVEWQGDHGINECCPSCCYFSTHAPDCALAACLKGGAE